MKYNNDIEYKLGVESKPIIIAICGKSATGKDTLAKLLAGNANYPTQKILSDTTRPQRETERDGIDYNFIEDHEFAEKIHSEHYLEWSKFNNWFYGTPKNRIYPDYINIGIFNAGGMKNLSTHFLNKYQIIPIYLEEPIFERINRSIAREGKFKLEHLRRALVDSKDFFGFHKKVLSKFPKYLIVKNELTRIGVYGKVNQFLNSLNIVGNIE